MWRAFTQLDLCDWWTCAVAISPPWARPASSVGAVERLRQTSALVPDDCVVALITSGGLKDPEVTLGADEAPLVQPERELGIPHYRRHHVGHGIGVEYYDLPILNPGTEIPLESGMVFEVETPYYEFGFGGAFIEDTVLVTDSGVKVLTELERELQVIDV